jgi:hypothetical protein
MLYVLPRLAAPQIAPFGALDVLKYSPRHMRYCGSTRALYNDSELGRDSFVRRDQTSSPPQSTLISWDNDAPDNMYGSTLCASVNALAL